MDKHVLRKFNRTKSFSIVRNLAFTLIELIVVIAILGILFAMAIIVLDPAKQIGKLNDAKRETDIKQITTALDTYYNDNNCYPIDLHPSLDTSPVYIKNVPVDPQTQESYLYLVDPVECPQWNVMFAKLNYSSTTKVDCPLASDCLPVNFGVTSGYNYCAVSGSIDCDFISTYELQTPTGTPVPTDTPIPNPSNTPTPTQVPYPTIVCPGHYYACTGAGVNGCNDLNQNTSICNFNDPLGYQCYCSSNCNGQCH